MKRNKSLVASILSTIVHAVGIFFVGYLTFVVFLLVSLAQSGEGGADPSIYFLFAMVVALLLFICVTLILTCITFSYINASHEKYSKRKGLTITVIVFDFIIAGLYVGYCATLKSVSATLIALIVLTATLLVCATLYIVDLCNEKKRIVKVKENENTLSSQEEKKVVTEEKNENADV